jgi:RNA polymerase sigma factor (sigma-70 family)
MERRRWLCDAYDDCVRYLVAVLRRLGEPADTARDLAEEHVQDVLALALRADVPFDDAQHCRHWMLRAAYHRAVQRHRQRVRRRDLLERYADEKRRDGAARPPTLSPLLDDVSGALARLRPDERELIRLHYYEGQTYEMIGKRLGVSAPTICRRMKKALASLHGWLSPGLGPP